MIHYWKEYWHESVKKQSIPLEIMEHLVALMLMANQLKEIAKTYNLFIMTSTQVNSAGLDANEKHDQRMIRGSKAIIDKADIAMLVNEATEEEKKLMTDIVVKLKCKAPTHVIDLYKIRSGRFKGVRIWFYYNLGNGDREDLFITDANNKVITLESYERIATYSSSTDTSEMLSIHQARERYDESYKPLEHQVKELEQNQTKAATTSSAAYSWD